MIDPVQIGGTGVPPVHNVNKPRTTTSGGTGVPPVQGEDGQDARSPIGMVLGGDFELLRPLGEGGMGVVWLAHERSLNRDVALKLMRPSNSPTRERRFEREAQALAALDHPSILPVLRTGADSATGLRYIATRAVLLAPDDIRRLCDDLLLCPYPRSHAKGAEEESHAKSAESAEAPLVTRHSSLVTAEGAPRPLPLADLLEGGKALPESAVLRIARDLAGALAAAHAAGILHRDLKPSNILFDTDGRALLADFGLAKFTSSGAGTGGSGESSPDRLDTLSFDESGHPKFLGSPAYAAPETFRTGADSATPAVDWYSFGAVLYEALTGQRPRSLRTPSSYDPAHISRTWDSFLAALLDPDPAKRLSDSAAIRRALDRIARHPARQRRRRWLWLGAFLGILGTLGILGHLGFLDSRSPDSSGRLEGGVEPAAVPQADGAEDTAPRPLPPPAPAALQPPRLSSIWQGDDRGPLQLLNTFRLPLVDDVVDEAIAAADPETQRLLREGDAAWTASPRDVVAANAAYAAAAIRLRDAMAATGGSEEVSPGHVVCRAVALARLSWTYVATGARGAADVPYREALELLDPLVEDAAARYGPLRSWLLAERAFMECMEDRFPEALADLREAAILLARHNPADAEFEAQTAVLQASIGGMFRKVDESFAALEMTNRAIKVLKRFFDSDVETTEEDAPFLIEMGKEENLQPLVDLLAGCVYRRGELLQTLGSRLEALLCYRGALDVWRVQFLNGGETYRLTYAQVLGRVAQAYAELDKSDEAIAAWEEMRETLHPLVESDPKQYGPIDAGILENIAIATRKQGDKERTAAEAETAAFPVAE